MKTYFRILNIIFFALIMGQASFAFCVIFMYFQGGLPNESDLSSAFLYVVPIMAAMCIGLSFIVPKQILGALRNSGQQVDLSMRLEKYKGVNIIRWALLEGAGLFSGVVAFVTGELGYLAVMGVILLLFPMHRPTEDKLREELELTEDEMQEARNLVP